MQVHNGIMEYSKLSSCKIIYTCMHTTIIVIYNRTCTWNAIVHVHIGLKTKYMWPGMRKSFTWETLISSNTFL